MFPESSETLELPERIKDLPYDTELSDVSGVSIVQIVPDPTKGHRVSWDTAEWRTAKAENALLEDLLYEWVNFSGWIMVDADLPNDRRYDVSVEAPEGTTNHELIRSAFESVFGLEFKEQTETHQVWLLEKAGDSSGGLEQVESRNSNWGTAQTPGGFGYEFRAGSMEDLTKILSKYLEGGIVFDETGLEGHYRFVLSMDHWKPESAVPALQKLGLRATRVDRGLPSLRIDYVKEK